MAFSAGCASRYSHALMPCSPGPSLHATRTTVKQLRDPKRGHDMQRLRHSEAVDHPPQGFASRVVTIGHQRTYLRRHVNSTGCELSLSLPERNNLHRAPGLNGCCRDYCAAILFSANDPLPLATPMPVSKKQPPPNDTPTCRTFATAALNPGVYA